VRSDDYSGNGYARGQRAGATANYVNWLGHARARFVTMTRKETTWVFG